MSNLWFNLYFFGYYIQIENGEKDTLLKTICIEHKIKIACENL